MRRASQTPTSRCGATLVEVLVACVILAVIAIGTAACLYLARGATTVQRDRRAALNVANSRLEEIRSAPYGSVARTNVASYTVYYLDRIGGTWHMSATDPGETVRIGAALRPLTTTAQLVDADGGSASYDCVRVTVRVGYRNGTSDSVKLETLRAP